MIKEKVQKVKIRQATKQGWIECEVGGVADLSYPDSKLRRGRVQGGGWISPTISTTPGIYRIEKKKMKMICERRYDEGLRTFNDGMIGAIRTIEAGGQTSD